VYGNAFCPSAFTSFGLIWRNLARVAAINLVGDYLIIIGKLVVAFLTAGIAGTVLIKMEYYQERVSSPIVPGLFIFIMAYLISSIFMVIYETGIDTIFLCFLIDEENNKGGRMLAAQSLQKIINEHADESKKMAEDRRASMSGGAKKATGAPSDAKA
jgi:hypothetical protein